MTAALSVYAFIHLAFCFFLFQSRVIDRMLVIALIFVIALWYFLPCIAVITLGYDILVSPSIAAAGIDGDAFFETYSLESFALWIVVGILLSQKNKCAILKSGKPCVKSPLLLERALILAFVIVLMIDFVSASFDYLENNAASLYEAQSGSVFLIVKQLLFSANIVIIVVKRRWTINSILSFLLVLVYAAIEIYGGARFFLLIPVVILSFKFLSESNITFPIILFATFGLMFCLYVLVPIVMLIGQSRANGVLQISSIVNLKEIQLAQENVLKELFAKLNSYSTAAILTSHASSSGIGMGAGGITPFLGSAVVFIPRYIWPERPVAGSMDGTIYGHPSRIVAYALLGSDSSNVGVSPLHICFWEFGYAGFPIFVISGVLFMKFINAILKKTSFYAKVVGVFLLNIPVFAFLLPSPDVMVMRTALACVSLAVFRLLGSLTLRRTGAVVVW